MWRSPERLLSVFVIALELEVCEVEYYADHSFSACKVCEEVSTVGGGTVAYGLRLIEDFESFDICHIVALYCYFTRSPVNGTIHTTCRCAMSIIFFILSASTTTTFGKWIFS